MNCLLQLIYLLSLLLLTVYILITFYTYEVFDLFLTNIASEYDYIIVGAGSAGSVVALRLAQKGYKVLLLEAGQHAGFLLDIPAFGPMLQNSVYDWQYRTESQQHACFGLNSQKSNWPMGKIVGGTGRLNNLVYARGHVKDYSNWYTNYSEYNYTRDVLWYFKKAEHHIGKYRQTTKYHSRGGPLRVSDLPYVTKIADAVLRAVSELGYWVGDINAELNSGFMEVQANLKDGRRWSTGHHLIEQRKFHPNLQLLTNAFVKKVLFYNKFEAKSVAFRRFGKDLIVKARKEVVLSAGVIGSPKILMLSGIGREEHLVTVGINSWNNLPVGENLIDHLTTGLDLILLNNSYHIDLKTMLSPFTVWDYFVNKNGPWTLPGCDAMGTIHSMNITESLPDLQFMLIPSGVSTDEGNNLRHLFGISDIVWNNYFAKLVNKPICTILPILLHPKSKGNVLLRDENPFSPPIIQPNYLSAQEDVETLVKGVKFIKQLLNTEAMRSFGAQLNTNHFPGCEAFMFDSDRYWECYVRHLSLTTYHPAGTCRMGVKADLSTVVNFQFKVHNTNKLRVADASVIPFLPSANINAAVVMIAEKVVDEILRDENLKSGFSWKQSVFFINNETI